jgi:hypothetical protein
MEPVLAVYLADVVSWNETYLLGDLVYTVCFQLSLASCVAATAITVVMTMCVFMCLVHLFVMFVFSKKKRTSFFVVASSIY